MYSFNKTQITNFKSGNSRCFLLANGLGGYACGSLINSLNRKHYGYLIASLLPPVNRVLVLSKISEQLKINDQIVKLDSDQYEDYLDDNHQHQDIDDNHQYLEKVEIDYLPKFYYQINDVLKMTKTIALKHGKNVVAVEYHLEPNQDGTLELEPLFNFRDHGEVSKKEDLTFESKLNNQELNLIPTKNSKVQINFKITEGQFIKNDDPYTSPQFFAYDSENGDTRVDYNYKPYKIRINFKKGETKTIGIVVKVNEKIDFSARTIIESEQERIQKVLAEAKISDSLGKDLVIASDAFLAYRSSTKLTTIMAGFPWFTDWGRDTMIAFTGITLVPKRFKQAREILESFAKYEKNGLIPNMFPDDGSLPIYNTVDASLWYFYACYKYGKYSKNLAFIKEKIYPVLKKIIYAYQNGTDFEIKMDQDFLIKAGSNQDQITWMDVRTHGVAVTPRHGKPVEINALWYNALMIMDYFSKEFGENDEEYLSLAKKVKTSFNQKFYFPKTHSLLDVVDPVDEKVRPNQVLLFTLPFCVLDEKYQREIFETITTELYNEYGLRSLSIKDPAFKPKYTGSLDNRDYAYHMGTTWGFLIGGYIDGYAKVHQNDPNVISHLREIVERFIPHLNDGCIGGIAEVFDGDIATSGKGCFSQAWSVGELLRSYYENILIKEPK